MKKLSLYGLLMVVAMLVSCKKAFLPVAISSANSYLVVEGVINSGGDSTIIHLSRTAKVNGNAKANTLNGCTVTVEGEQGINYTLQGMGNGKYVSGGLAIDAAKKYRLHIITNDGKEYASDYVAVKPTPPIDDIPYDTVKYNSNDGKYAQLYIDTHDASNNTRYYRWEYIETWKIMSFYQSIMIIDKGKIRERLPQEQINTCYATDTSTNIYIGSSAKLDQDVISKVPIGIIPNKSLKLKYRYTVLVKQYALSKDEYQFWENMQKNTEQLGSIFDAQPSQLSGNIHNVKDAGEPVIGYLSITNTQTKRIFINGNSITSNALGDYPYACEQDEADYTTPQTPASAPLDFFDVPATGDVLSLLINGGGLNVPLRPLYTPGPMSKIKGYLYTTVFCADCSIRGKTTPPSYWVE